LTPVLGKHPWVHALVWESGFLADPGGLEDLAPGCGLGTRTTGCRSSAGSGFAAQRPWCRSQPPRRRPPWPRSPRPARWPHPGPDCRPVPSWCRPRAGSAPRPAHCPHVAVWHWLDASENGPLPPSPAPTAWALASRKYPST